MKLILERGKLTIEPESIQDEIYLEETTGTILRSIYEPCVTPKGTSLVISKRSLPQAAEPDYQAEMERRGEQIREALGQHDVNLPLVDAVKVVADNLTEAKRRIAEYEKGTGPVPAELGQPVERRNQTA